MNWKRKEAGFVVVGNQMDRSQYFCEKFHNKEELDNIVEKYKWIHPEFEYHIGTFNNDKELQDAMSQYTRNEFNIESSNYIDDMGEDAHLHTDERMFLRKWYNVKEQGLHDDDCDLPVYYRYNPYIENKEYLDELLKQPMLYKESERVFFMIGIQEVCVYETLETKKDL